MAFDYQAITVSTTALALDPTKYDTDPPMEKCTISVESDDVRVRWDGTNPTASEGLLWKSGGLYLLEDLREIRGFKVIRVTTDAKLKCIFDDGLDT